MPGNEKPKTVEVITDYICPISNKLIGDIVEPVLTPSGHIYEKADLFAWLKKSGNKDPYDVTKTLTVEMLIPNFAIKEIASSYGNLKKEVATLKTEASETQLLLLAVLEQNKLLKKQLVRAAWNEHGKAIDKKLDKTWGQDPARQALLKHYKAAVLDSEDELQFQGAVQNTEVFKMPDYSKRRWFTMFGGTGDTAKVAVEFESNVTKSKGW